MNTAEINFASKATWREEFEKELAAHGERTLAHLKRALGSQPSSGSRDRSRSPLRPAPLCEECYLNRRRKDLEDRVGPLPPRMTPPRTGFLCPYHVAHPWILQPFAFGVDKAPDPNGDADGMIVDLDILGHQTTPGSRDRSRSPLRLGDSD